MMGGILMLKKIVKNVQNQTPLVHNITNYVTVNDCANIILACGGSPIMADEITEVEEITTICQSLVINIGTLNSRTIEAMITAGKKANQLNHPVILDPVGAGASTLRTETVERLIKEVKFSVIRGNISEIKTLAAGTGQTLGVDASAADLVTDKNIDSVIEMARTLSEKTGAVIAISGVIDLVVDTNQVFMIRNGHPLMSKITGAGCMLTAVIGAYCGANPNQVIEATVTAICAMGLCGEIAATKCEGTSSFKMHLIDAMSTLNETILEGGMKIETK